MQTPAATDGAKAKPVTKAEVVTVEVEAVPEPVKRPSKKNAEVAPKKDFKDVINSWTDDE